MSYSLSEYAEMHYYYGVAQGNGHLVARLYREQLERRGEEREHYPDHRVFINAHNTLMAGRVPGRSSHEGVPRADPDVRDQVVEQVQSDLSTSTRTISRTTGVPRTTVMRILKSEGYHAFHMQRVQQLLPADYPRRVAFCRTMLERTERDPNIFEKILWTDESRFERIGVFNIHNYHSWAIENPHMTRSSNFQVRFSINLWSGIVNGTFIGPFELPSRLNGAQYLEFLQNNLDDLLEAVDLQTRRRIIFQNDGAPCHYTRTVREHLDQRLPRRWIGRGGPILWPARSPDLNPNDFFIWGYYKEMVYAREINIEAELREKLKQAATKIRQQTSSFRRLKQNFLRRCRLCIEAEGRHFENLL